jgi:hypothetical protein
VQASRYLCASVPNRGGLRRSGRRRLGLLTALGACAVIGAGAYIGGELSLGQLLGAKHTAKPIVPPADFTPVLEAGALSKTTPGTRGFQRSPDSRFGHAEQRRRDLRD